MERYKYRAINANGRSIRGMLTANNEVDLYEQLQKTGLELLDCKVVSEAKGFSGILNRQSVQIRDLIQFFVHMEQMQGAGVPFLAALGDIRDSSDNDALRDILSSVHRRVSDGASFPEAMEDHPKIFKNLHIALMKASEKSGNQIDSYRQLIIYLKWVDRMQSRIRKAIRYPIIIMAVVVLTIVVMMGFVVPQIIGFIENLDQDVPFYTKALVATSGFFQEYYWAVLIGPILVAMAIYFFKKSSAAFAYRVDAFALNAPIMGPIIRKIAMARYAQTFGSLYASGIDVIQALKSARATTSNLVLVEAFENVEKAISTGSPLAEAFEASGEFPSMVVSMVTVGQNTGNLTSVLDQVSEFYTQDVDEAVDGLITMIEPMLTAILGIVILWIAVAVFGPIYSSFENIDF